MQRTRIIPVGCAVWIVAHHRTMLAQISPGEISCADHALEGIDNCTRCHKSRREIRPDCALLALADGSIVTVTAEFVFIFAGGEMPTEPLKNAGTRPRSADVDATAA